MILEEWELGRDADRGESAMSAAAEARETSRWKSEATDSKALGPLRLPTGQRRRDRRKKWSPSNAILEGLRDGRKGAKKEDITTGYRRVHREAGRVLAARRVRVPVRHVQAVEGEERTMVVEEREADVAARRIACCVWRGHHVGEDIKQHARIFPRLCARRFREISATNSPSKSAPQACPNPTWIAMGDDGASSGTAGRFRRADATPRLKPLSLQRASQSRDSITVGGSWTP
ncbi:hypothetical protein DFH06DRAFT_1435687 [Mycena polygramma]|nr:hypothetical protein DFH06DRAFT_1435687 [Mycena polygramma]